MTAAVCSDGAELVHATCVRLDGGAVLIAGASGAGKSDLALRLIDRGARLVADDYTCLHRDGAALIASAPPTIAGMIEVRGVGIVALPHEPHAEVRLAVDLDRAAERLPEPATRNLAGIDLPLVVIAAFEPSAPIKVELALARLAKATR